MFRFIEILSETLAKIIEHLALASESFRLLQREDPKKAWAIVAVVLLFGLFFCYKVYSTLTGEIATSRRHPSSTAGKSSIFDRLQGKKGTPTSEKGQDTNPDAFREKENQVQLSLASEEGLLSRMTTPRDSLDEMWEKDYGELEEKYTKGISSALGMDDSAIKNMESSDRALQGARDLLGEKRYADAISAANRAVKSNSDNIFAHAEARAIRAEAMKAMKNDKGYNIEKQKAAALNYLAFREALPNIAKKIEASAPQVENAMGRVFQYFHYVGQFENRAKRPPYFSTGANTNPEDPNR